MEGVAKPLAGIDYPRTFTEFYKFFSEEAGAWTTSRGYLHCRACEAETSITAGTIFQDTRSPLRTWCLAMWFVTSQKYGASALGLKRVLGLSSYQTAWTWLHKLRRAMVRPGRERLKGVVEVDETYVGGEEEGVHGRETHKKAIVVIAVEMLEPKGFGRVRMRRVPDCAAASLTGFVRDAVAPGACVHTDGWPAYDGLSKLGYERKVTVLSASNDPAHVLMPGVHRVASLLKRVLLGTHQGAVRNPSSRLLPRRVHVPVQPSYFGVTRAALLPADGAGRLHRTDVISRARRRQDPGRRRRVTTTCWGLLASSGYPPRPKASEAHQGASGFAANPLILQLPGPDSNQRQFG